MYLIFQLNNFITNYLLTLLSCHTEYIMYKNLLLLELYYIYTTMYRVYLSKQVNLASKIKLLYIVVFLVHVFVCFFGCIMLKLRQLFKLYIKNFETASLQELLPF